MHKELSLVSEMFSILCMSQMELAICCIGFPSCCYLFLCNIVFYRIETLLHLLDICFHEVGN
jgi:hypothetical protein